jgi:hypothetical protein
MSHPGMPLSPINSRFLPVPGKARRYYDISTGRTLSRYSVQKTLSRIYGFYDLNDYHAFSRMFSGGLGGLTGMRPTDVSRVRTLIYKYERDHNLPAGTAFRGNASLEFWTKEFLSNTDRSDQKFYENHMLDRFGVRAYTAAYLPGETPKKKRRR